MFFYGIAKVVELPRLSGLAANPLPRSSSAERRRWSMGADDVDAQALKAALQLGLGVSLSHLRSNRGRPTWIRRVA